MINNDLVYNYLTRFLPVIDTSIRRFKADCQRAINQGADSDIVPMLEALIADDALTADRVRATWNAYNQDNQL